MGRPIGSKNKSKVTSVMVEVKPVVKHVYTIVEAAEFLAKKSEDAVNKLAEKREEFIKKIANDGALYTVKWNYNDVAKAEFVARFYNIDTWLAPLFAKDCTLAKAFEIVNEVIRVRNLDLRSLTNSASNGSTSVIDNLNKRLEMEALSKVLEDFEWVLVIFKHIEEQEQTNY